MLSNLNNFESFLREVYSDKEESFFETIKARGIVESNHEWRKWLREIPHINFKNEWKIKIIPPFGGAIVRFSIEHMEKHISVFLDCYDELAIFGEPYWEMYPYKDDVFRVKMNNVEELLKKIEEEISGIYEENY